jgi:isoleucyl-tRNA synthetase
MTKQAFDPVPSPFSFAEAEHQVSDFWRAEQIYHKSLEQRKDAPRFVFYEGPPTANGLPHPGHCLTRTIKDIFPRYKTMAGSFCERKAGWDTHGLPVEIEVCKELGIIDGGKEAIEAYGVEAFNRKCIESVFRYTKEWEELTDRIGFWVDLDEAYVTFKQSYVESVWWALKQLFDRGLLYQGHKVVWWWAQGGTALSAGEVGEGYRDTDDPAITVRFALSDDSKKTLGLEGEDAALLAWTTTPWTLVSNCACCVGADLDYAIAKTEDGRLSILAEALVEKVLGEDAEVLRTLKGKDLVGINYTPLFDYDAPKTIEGDDDSGKHWLVIQGDFVDLETGTGIVHMAPAFGEDDYRVCKERGVGFLCFIKPDGTFDERVTDVDPYDETPFAGQFCKAADKGIVRLLKERGALVKHDQYRHSYPFCPRAENDPLIQYARRSWFIKTSQFIDDFTANNNKIGWQPEHIRDGRFGNFLENNVDWSLSRERYWGTPLPVWVCEKTGHMECMASYEELLAKPDVQGTEVWEKAKALTPDLSEHLKVHKPYIDAVSYQSPKDPTARMKRVTEVIDCWFDAGCMPFAQWGYPHLPESDDQFTDRFPADFISEALDQTRGWFYALLAVSTLVFGKEKKGWPHPFKNCICLGLIQGEDGTKLSKRLKNYSEPSLLFEKFSADALRWSFVAKNPPTTSTRLSERIVEEVQRELLMRWYNVYSFFVIYANLDGFDPQSAPLEFLRQMEGGAATATAQEAGDAPFLPRAERSELDRWILSELDRTTVEVRAALDNFETYPAARALSAFVDGLSNWYVRRSRARFWASGWSDDKANAYWTLYECLLNLARLMAPFTPFFAEVTWRNLAKALPGAAASVHLCDYPEADASAIDTQLLDDMAATREVVNLGLSARRVENIKVRQPLGLCELVLSDPAMQAGLEAHATLIQEELNIKRIEFTANPEEYVRYEVKPNFKVLGPKFGKQMKAVAAALNKGDSADFHEQLQDNGVIQLDLNGTLVEVTDAEVDIRLSAKEGFAAAQGKNMVVVLATEITEELRHEGWVREVIRGVQDLRKDQGLAYDDRIQVRFHTDSDALGEVIKKFTDTIAKEVLANGIKNAVPENGKALKIDDAEINIAIAVD